MAVPWHLPHRILCAVIRLYGAGRLHKTERSPKLLLNPLFPQMRSSFRLQVFRSWHSRAPSPFFYSSSEAAMQTCRAHADACPNHKSNAAGQWAVSVDVGMGLIKMTLRYRRLPDHVQLGWRLMRELGDSNYTSEVGIEPLDSPAIKGSRILDRNMSAPSCCPSSVGTSLACAIPSR